MIRVLVASRSAEVEAAIRASESLELAGQFAGGVDAADPLPPGLSGDVLLLDGQEANGRDWSAIAELPIPVVLLMDSPNPAQVAAALRAGIRGVIPADATPQEIEGAVHAVNAGLVVTPPHLFPESDAASEEMLDPLSERELEVLDQLAEGLSNKLIAHRLNISEHTVKTHVASIFAKLGASSRTEAVSQAIRRGLVML